MKITKQFNSLYAKQKEKVKKALSTAVNSGASLIRETFDPIITDLAISLRPEMALIAEGAVYRRSNKAKFRALTALAGPSGGVGESSTARVSNSSYTDVEITKKIFKRKGRLTNFLKETSDEDLDVANVELESLVLQQVQDIINGVLWGNADANAYGISGIDKFISSNRFNYGATAQGAELTTLEPILNAQAIINDRGGSNHRKVILCSPFMKKKISQLQTGVNLNTDVSGGGPREIRIAGGWILNSLDGYAIVESSACRPAPTEAAHNIGTVTGATATTGGTIANNTYYFSVAPVTSRGEQLASAQVTVVAGGSNTSTITLSWDDVPEAYYYRVYATTTTGVNNHLFVREVAAWNYDSDGLETTRRTSYVFTATVTTADSTVGAHRATQRPLVGETVNGVVIPPETIFIWDLDLQQGMGKFEFVNEDVSRQSLITAQIFGKEVTTEDWEETMLKTYGCLVPADQRTSIVLRGLKTDTAA